LQVKERQPIRVASVVNVELTAAERKFYDAITQSVRRRVAQAGKSFSAFHLVMPQQRMASCIPAMVSAYRSGELGDFEDLVSESFGVGEDDLSADEKSDDASSLKDDFEEFLSYDFEANDSKYKKLREQLLAAVANDKVIIFSYFKGTLFYLQRRLESDGIPCALIHGGILDQDDRDAEIANFRDSDKVRVLLSSEVGSEGMYS
jgi:superfamily II DNA or RNA helicase